jgi:REP element-mobilizing transposase RayT
LKKLVSILNGTKSTKYASPIRTFRLGWQDGFHPEIVETNWFIKQKVNYIHNNPVQDKIVTLAEDYYFSSARNYAGLENELDVVVLDLF